MHSPRWKRRPRRPIGGVQAYINTTAVLSTVNEWALKKVVCTYRTPQRPSLYHCTQTAHLCGRLSAQVDPAFAERTNNALGVHLVHNTWLNFKVRSPRKLLRDYARSKTWQANPTQHHSPSTSSGAPDTDAAYGLHHLVRQGHAGVLGGYAHSAACGRAQSTMSQHGERTGTPTSLSSHNRSRTQGSGRRAGEDDAHSAIAAHSGA